MERVERPFRFIRACSVNIALMPCSPPFAAKKRTDPQLRVGSACVCSAKMGNPRRWREQQSCLDLHKCKRTPSIV